MYRLAKSSEYSSYPEIDFDNVPQYWRTKVLPKLAKLEDIMYKSSITLGNVQFWDEIFLFYMKDNKFFTIFTECSSIFTFWQMFLGI